MKEFAGKPIRVLVVWEPVLPTDWGAPATTALKRIADRRAIQYWDKGRLLSRALGEHDRKSVVWDHIAVYARGVIWKQAPPESQYAGGPVLDVIAPSREAIARALATSLGSPAK